MNLRQIGVAMQTYANTHNHEFPDSLSTILAAGLVTPDVFVNCGGIESPASGPTIQAVLADFANPGHCSYLYFGSGLSDRGYPNTVTACEVPMQPPAPGMNVLFLDGHVEYISGVAAQQLRAALGSGPVAWTATGGTTPPSVPVLNASTLPGTAQPASRP